MAGKGDIRAGGAYVELFTKDAALVKGLRSAQKQLQGFGKNVMAVGGFFAGLGAGLLTPLAAAVTHFTTAGSALNDLSERTGLAASNLAELKFAAEQSGATLDDVEKALRNMAKKGITESFDQAAARIAAIPDATKRAQAAIETFGKSGTTLLPMLGTLQQVRQQARALGLVPTDEAVKSADALGDAFDQVRSVLAAAVFEIGGALAPVMLPLAENVRNVIGSVNRWIRENGQLIRTVAMVGAGLLAAGTVITGVGVAIFGLGAAAGVAATVLTTIGSVVAAIVSPIGLVTIGLTAAAVAFFRFTDAGRTAVGIVMEKLAPLVQFAREVVGGIADALQAGDLGLAASIGMAAIRVAFEVGKLAILTVWEDVKLRVLSIIDEIGVSLAPTIAFMGSLWQSFATYVGAVIGGLAVAIAPFWQGFMLAGTTALNTVMEWVKLVQGAFELFFGAAQVGFDALIAKAAIITKTVIPAANLGAAGTTGFDAGAALSKANQAAAAAGEQARKDADARRTDREAGADQRIGAQRDRLRKAQEELDELNRQAAAAREAAQAGPGKAAGLKPPDAAELKSSATVTGFSGAALLLAGQGGGVQDMAKDIRKQILIQKNQEKHLQRIAEKEGAVAT